MDKTNLAKEHHLDDTNCSDDVSPEQSITVENSEICNVFGNPEVLPRLGKEYQVEIPPLQGSKGEEIEDGDSCNFFVGLPLPVMWISKEAHFMEHNLEKPGDGSVQTTTNKNELDKSFKETKIISKDDDEKPIIEMTEMKVNKIMKTSEASENKASMHPKDNIKQGYYLAPGVSCDIWNNIEEASFLLGLYIFGKNLVLVQKFVGTKQMGDVLSFYYGKFYRSKKYRRWTECRKARGKKCIFGLRLFKGWRQQELFSRLLLRVAEESKNILMEVLKAFGDGKMSLEEYVFALKATVGLEAFVEAVGIGSGKQDLTDISMEPLKPNHAVSVRPEIPIGKACSSLTPLEIVNYLTGDFRLSKARSSDLFWEAVWPRLLARGWHSEQPSNGFTTGLKHSLVFLVPGIKKFSRRKLVRGNHYFDSVSDVLGKVASDPGLLELDNSADKGCKVENGTDDLKLDQEDFPCQQRHCYLKPRTPSHSLDIVKFTVVDTSMARGSALNMRELRSLPVELLNISSFRPFSENNDSYSSSNESIEESDSEEKLHFDKVVTVVDNSQASKGKSHKELRVCSNGNYFQPESSNGVFSDSIDSAAKVSKEDNPKLRNATVVRFKQKSRSDNKRHLVANVTKKRRKLNSFVSKSLINIKEDACCSKDDVIPNIDQNIQPRVDPSHDKCSSSSGASTATSLDGNSKDTIFHQSRALIDLNLPIPPDAETDEPVTLEMRERQPETSKELANPIVVKSSEGLDIIPDQQIHNNSRRLSSRNRPPTARALEARALGLLDVKRKRKNKDAFLDDNFVIKPPRRARPKVKPPTENPKISIEESKIEDTEVIGTCNRDNEVFSKLEI